MDAVKRSRRVLASLSAVATVVALLALLPRTLGTSWAPVASVLKLLTVRDLAVLAFLWLAGLMSYAGVLTSSLPGLSRSRALLLNLSGSAVANIAPFGGAAGVGLNFVMVRSWKFSIASFATFTAVSNLWDWLGKLVLAAAVLGSLLVHHGLPRGALLTGLRVALSLVAGLLVLAAAVLARDATSAGLGRILDRAVWFRLTTFATALPTLRRAVALVVRARWAQLSLGMVGYLGLQAVLLGACLDVVGSDLGAAAILGGFAAERLTTLVPLTPGGAGLADTVCAGVLVALGGDPVVVAAAVVLYRGFTFLLEIPVGGVGILGWLLLRRRVRTA